MEKNAIPVSVKRCSSGFYLFDFSEKADFKIFRGLPGEKFSENNFYSSGGESIKIMSSYPKERLVFAVKKNEEAGYYYVSEKHMPMSGTPNFRDLGGIVNKHGKQIKWGSFFRSGVLNRLTETDLAYFNTLGIKTVIDFRSDYEAEREPESFPGSFNINYVRAPIGNPADFDKLIEASNKNENGEDTVHSVMMRGAKGFVDGIKGFQPVFDAMIKGVPFLFHCSAGKDRTGLGAALILSLLDVEKEAVFEDYLLSNEYTIPYFAKYISVLTDLGISAEIARAAAGVKREFLETTLNAIDDKYGSFVNMAEEVFGINEKLKRELLQKYTI